MLKLRSRHNKNQSAWLVEPGIRVGRKATSDFILDSPSAADLQFTIAARGDQLLLKNRVEDTTIEVNGKPVASRCPLREGDRIRVADLELEIVDPKKESPGERPIKTDWSLKANNTALNNRVFALSEVTLIGRANECDISMAVAHLSRRHAELRVMDGLLYVKDLGSANGTYLNGKRVTEARVRRGDELRFDTLSFGVIGPSDELDKTSVRQVSPEWVKRVRAEPAAKANTRASAKPVSKASTETHKEPKTLLQRSPELKVQKSTSHWHWWLLVGLALVVASLWWLRR